MRGLCRNGGSDLTLAVRPGWTHSVSLRNSVVSGLPYAMASSRNGVFVRHMACNVTASFRARATFAFLGHVRSAIALAQLRSRVSPRFRQKIAFAAS